MPLNEADTCRVYVTPKLKEAGWDNTPHSFTEQKTFTDGRVFASERADYLLRFTHDFMISRLSRQNRRTRRLVPDYSR